MTLQNMDDYGTKKKFLDCLERCNGKMFDACEAIGVTEDFIGKLRAADDVFSDAVQQVQDEIALTGNGEANTPSLIIGIRPYDLHHTINTRLQYDNDGATTKKRSIHLQTAKDMCRFLGYYRGVGWSFSHACSLAKLSTTTVRRWIREFPEFAELYDAAEIDSISEIYDMARQRALDPSASGDAMRSFILKHKGGVIGFGNGASQNQQNAPLVNINVSNTPQQSDAIVRAHEKALESSMGIISIPKITSGEE